MNTTTASTQKVSSPTVAEKPQKVLEKAMIKSEIIKKEEVKS